ncbi:MAG: pyruvate kinase [Alphaproteobacteria bacterium]
MAKKAAPKQTETNTKIIATLGPVSNTYESIRALYEAGVDCFRLNFSHGSHEDHGKSVDIIRKIEKDTGATISIMADLQGPKLRIGAFKDETIDIKKGQEIRFDLDPALGDAKRVSFPHPEILAALEPGAQFLMDDGNVGMRIKEKGEGYVVAIVEYGKTLASKKGVNVPDLSRHVEAITEKDRADLAYALSKGVDWVALSFVQGPEDIKLGKALIAGRAKIIAKIEKPDAAKNFAAILKEADAAMVARGDLGVEIPLYKVPGVQKRMLMEGRKAKKPIIVATQMLDSMRETPRPTRAEVSDVAQAVLDGASAVMLSGETSVGKFPVLAVEMMDKICKEMESEDLFTITREMKGHKHSAAAAFDASARPPANNDFDTGERKKKTPAKKPVKKQPGKRQ